MNWAEHHSESRLRHVSECRAYVIAADVPSDGHMPWWIANHADGKHVAAGYGDEGLAKCQRFCLRHLERLQADEKQSAPAPAAHTVPTTSLPKNEAVQPSHVQTSAAQSALF